MYPQGARDIRKAAKPPTAVLFRSEAAAGYNGFPFYFALRGEKPCINNSRAAQLPRIRMIYEVFIL